MSAASFEAPTGPAIRSLIPARIDRLPWSPFHTRMVVALGVAWVLDGLEITIASAVGDVLSEHAPSACPPPRSVSIATVYLLGEVSAHCCSDGCPTGSAGRKLFIVTLGVYLVGSGLTALTCGSSTGWIVFLYATRFIAGTGIGGEYAAINSAIDELIPARYRGRVDIAVNGTYWGGAILGTLAQLVLLNALDRSLGWRLGFLIGPGARAVSSCSSGATCRRARAGRSCTAARTRPSTTIR